MATKLCFEDKSDLYIWFIYVDLQKATEVFLLSFEIGSSYYIHN